MLKNKDNFELMLATGVEVQEVGADADAAGSLPTWPTCATSLPPSVTHLTLQVRHLLFEEEDVYELEVQRPGYTDYIRRPDDQTAPYRDLYNQVYGFSLTRATGKLGPDEARERVHRLRVDKMTTNKVQSSERQKKLGELKEKVGWELSDAGEVGWWEGWGGFPNW